MKKNYKKLIIHAIIFLFVLVINILESAALTDCSQIPNNGVITNDTYLTDDLTTSSGNCITFGADNITLDCQGYSLIGPSGGYNGIITNQYNSIKIENCKIFDFHYSLVLGGTNDGLIRNNSFYDFIHVTGSTNNRLENNNFYDRLFVYSANTFNQNIINVDAGTNSAIILDGPGSIFSNNIISGSGNFGISTPNNAVNNTITNNTISNFYTAIEMGTWGEGNERNIIVDNKLVNNTIAIAIVMGDLNEISNNIIDSTLTPPGLAYLIKKGLIKEDSNLPTDGFGFDLQNSYNNVVWDNNVYDFNNNYDEGANLYCFNGLTNEYYINDTLVWNGTIVNQELCDQYYPVCIDIPACNETLNDGGPFGGEGGLRAGDGWRIFNDPDADDGEARYTRPNNGDQFSWHVHTLANTFDVYVWKFEANVTGSLASNAKYEIKHSLGTITKQVDWTTPGNEWIYLGRYTFVDNANQGVYLSDNADGVVVADAVRIENIGPPWQNVRHVVREIGPHLGPFSI